MTNTAEILAAANADGITAESVGASLYAAEQAVADYPARCAGTVVITATVLEGAMTRSDIAKRIAASTGCALSAAKMAVTRYYRAGAILLAHGDLDPVQVVAFANANDNAACDAVVEMSDEDAAEAIAPSAKRGASGSQKTEAEKDLAALESLLKRIAKAGKDGDRARVEALDTALTTVLSDALAEAYSSCDADAEVAV